MAKIHATAIVDPQAELADDVEVGPYAIIGSQVRIGARTVVGPHVVIDGRTTIGCDNKFFPSSSIGAMPQDISHGGEVTALEIGDRNTIREFCTVNTGTLKEYGVTRVGSDNWIMACVHIAHDVQLGSRTILANNVMLAGHVRVGDWAVIGGASGVHQFVRVGAHAMIGFQGHVAQDVAPYMTVDGNPLATRAVNLIGLKRRDFSDERIAVIRKMHKLIFRAGLPLAQAQTEVEALRGQGGDEDIALMLDFLGNVAKRGLVR
jgi:UDP-N-acetylglucosamine acyltransferase